MAMQQSIKIDGRRKKQDPSIVFQKRACQIDGGVLYSQYKNNYAFSLRELGRYWPVCMNFKRKRVNEV
ncbi:MAG: hypothetical protein LBU47_08245, partial [Christensenellaceae bacterium]|jgi:hypothetical protein|nr:hypothetical protein [Christensenellaceae bacterium]